MRLISNARDGWRFWSVRLGTLATLLQTLALWVPDFALTTWNSLPPELKEVIPQQWVFVLSLGLAGAAVVARFVKQPRLEQEPPATPTSE